MHKMTTEQYRTDEGDRERGMKDREEYPQVKFGSHVLYKTSGILPISQLLLRVHTISPRG